MLQRFLILALQGLLQGIVLPAPDRRKCLWHNGFSFSWE
jgi:hypothetical protein